MEIKKPLTSLTELTTSADAMTYDVQQRCLLPAWPRSILEPLI